MSFEQILISVPIFLFSLTVHEFAHGYIAYRFGDPTAKDAGRLTLNPIPHIDPMGALFFVLSGFRFGWAKPVPVVPYHFSDPKRGMLWSAAAGPISNLLLAAGFGLIFRFSPSVVPDAQFGTIVAKMAYYAVYINCALAFFNLLPVPPLDGSKVLFGLLPQRYEHIAYELERTGPLGLLILIGIGFITGYSIIWLLIGPFVERFVSLFTGI